MIIFGCPKCGKQFQVPDRAVGQHGWCKGCGAIIRVPESSNASDEDIVDVKMDPQVEALLRHMASQLKEYRTRAKESQEQLAALRDNNAIAAAQEQALNKAGRLSKELGNQLKAMEEDRQAAGAELRELMQSLRGLLESGRRLSQPQDGRPSEEQLKEMAAAVEHERNAHDATRTQFHLLERQYSALASQGESRTGEFERLQLSLDRAEQRAAELAERCGKLDEQAATLRAERDEARRMLEDRHSVEQTTEAAAARLQEKESMIQRLSEELRAALESKGEREAENRQRLDDIEHLSAELSGITQSAEEEILQIQSELNAERKGHALAERGLMHAQDDLRALRRDFDALHQIETEKIALERETVLLREALQKAEETIQGYEQRFQENQQKLSEAEKRIQMLEDKTTGFLAAPRLTGHVGRPANNVADAGQEAAGSGAAPRQGPFPGPFIPPSEQTDHAQGITLIPEVIDNDFDDGEMLDTLMRFLGPE